MPPPNARARQTCSHAKQVPAYVQSTEGNPVFLTVFKVKCSHIDVLLRYVNASAAPAVTLCFVLVTHAQFSCTALKKNTLDDVSNQ